jgi:hypothetical protein
MIGSRDADLRRVGIEKLSLMLERAGFHNYSRRHEIDLGEALGRVTPAFFFYDPNGHYEGICVFLPDPWGQRSAALDELRRLFFEVIEVNLQDLTDMEAMRVHFFRLARALYGRNSAVRVRDELSWFLGEPAQPARDRVERVSEATKRPQTTPPDAWGECIELLESKWRSVAQSLRDAGLPGPTDVDWEIPIGGRVGEKRAVMMWQNGGDYLALVEGQPMNSTQISISPSIDASVLASMLIERLSRIDRLQ